jgi:predicted MFS family arabinose efflux permease
MLYGFAFMIFFTFFQKRLIADLGFSSDAAGNLFLIVGVAGLAGGVIVGMFSDRIGRGRAIAVACLLDALAAFLFTFWPSLPVLVIASAIFGVSAFGIPGLVGAACGDKFGAVLATASLGFVTIFIGVGQGVGPYVAGRMEDAFSSLGPSYLLSAGLFVAAALSALFLRRGSPAQSVAECD